MKEKPRRARCGSISLFTPVPSEESTFILATSQEMTSNSLPPASFHCLLTSHLMSQSGVRDRYCIELSFGFGPEAPPPNDPS